MATRYAYLAKSVRGPDLAEREVLAALVSRDECAALMGRLAESAAGRSGRALLSLLGQLGTPACTWLEGDLAVELFDEEGGTKVRVMSEIGAGLRERVLPLVTFALPLDELLATLDRNRELVAELRLERVSARCALLLAADAESGPMATAFDISETSLSWAGATGADDVDSGWDDAAQTT